MIKLTGKAIVSLINKFTLLLLVLFCIDINIIKNKAELKKTDKVGDDNLVDLLRYYELVKEIKVANATQI